MTAGIRNMTKQQTIHGYQNNSLILNNSHRKTMKGNLIELVLNCARKTKLFHT